MTFNEMCTELGMEFRPAGCIRQWKNGTYDLEVFAQSHSWYVTDEDRSWRAHFTGTQFTSFEMDFYTVDTMYNFIRMMVRAWEEAVQYIEQR